MMAKAPMRNVCFIGLPAQLPIGTGGVGDGVVVVLAGTQSTSAWSDLKTFCKSLCDWREAMAMLVFAMTPRQMEVSLPGVWVAGVAVCVAEPLVPWTHVSLSETPDRLGASEKLIGTPFGRSYVILNWPPKMGSWMEPPASTRHELLGRVVGR